MDGNISFTRVLRVPVCDTATEKRESRIEKKNKKKKQLRRMIHTVGVLFSLLQLQRKQRLHKGTLSPFARGHN